jgi:hypothetical protein
MPSAAEQFLAKAAECDELRKNTESESEIRALQDSQRSFSALARNEEWLANNFDKTIHAPNQHAAAVTTSGERPLDNDVIAAEERHILSCLGAAVIMQWNRIPKNLQRELFDIAGSTGAFSDAKTLRAQIARFLHQHKDDAGAPPEVRTSSAAGAAGTEYRCLPDLDI